MICICVYNCRKGLLPPPASFITWLQCMCIQYLLYFTHTFVLPHIFYFTKSISFLCTFYQDKVKDPIYMAHMYTAYITYDVLYTQLDVPCQELSVTIPSSSALGRAYQPWILTKSLSDYDIQLNTQTSIIGSFSKRHHSHNHQTKSLYQMPLVGPQLV